MPDLQPFQQRVLEEREDLRVRTEKLLAFIETPAFSRLGRAEQKRMREQAKAMTAYGNVLAERIAHFTGPDDEIIVFNVDWYEDKVPEVKRVAMDVRQLAERGIPPLSKGEQNLQHVFRRDFEAGEQFKDVVLL